MEWHQAVARGHLFETGFRLWHAPASEYRHVVSPGAPVTNDDGSVREWIGTITDIHEPNEGTWRHSIVKYLRGSKLRAELAAMLGSG